MRWNPLGQSASMSSLLAGENKSLFAMKSPGRLCRKRSLRAWHREDTAEEPALRPKRNIEQGMDSSSDISLDRSLETSLDRPLVEKSKEKTKKTQVLVRMMIKMEESVSSHRTL